MCSGGPLKRCAGRHGEAGNPDWERIESDSGQEYLGEEDGCTELCTVLTVLWKTKKPVMDEELGVQTGTKACVCFKRVAGKVELTGDTETGMSPLPGRVGELVGTAELHARHFPADRGHPDADCD